MIKINKSLMYDQKIITFFSGNDLAKSGHYMYEESLPLFAEENLGINLVEYDTAPDGVLSLVENSEIKKIVDELQVSSGKRIDIIDTHLTDMRDFDLLIEYSDQYFELLDIEIIQYPMENIGRFKVVFQNLNAEDTGMIAGIDQDGMSYIRVKISEYFLKNRQFSLSAPLHTHFNPKRCVDTQIIFFLLTSSLGGISTSREREKMKT